MFAGNQQLDNLCVIVDHNGLQIDGPVEEVNDPMPLADKFRAFKFHVVEKLADGNDFDQIRAAFAEARATRASLRPLSPRPQRARACHLWRTRLAGTAGPQR